MDKGIVVLGSLNVDFVVRGEKRPKEGETVFGTEFSVFPGGKGANQAVAAAKLGGRVTMAGRIGDDVFSKILLDSLAKAGVKSSHVLLTRGVPTGSAFIFVDAKGENSIVVVPGANGHYTKRDMDVLKPCLEEAAMLMLQLEMPFRVVKHGLCLARSLGVKVMLDPAPPRFLPQCLLKDVDVITPNRHEAAFLTGREVIDVASAESAALCLLDQGVKAVVVKLGAQGAVYAKKGRTGIVLGHRVRARDTTGAGDAFAGALALALCEGKDLGEACHFANAAAALSVTKKGAQPSMPNRNEVETFLNDWSSDCS